jgi:hypothetical protein
MTDPFFCRHFRSFLPSSPNIVNILGNIQTFDSGVNPLTSFLITGVAVMQGSTTLMPLLQTFSVSSPVTYADTLNPLNQATLVPSALNLAFLFKSNPSFQYSYELSNSGIPDGGFVLYDDVEGAAVPEPGSGLPVTLVLLALLIRGFYARR